MRICLHSVHVSLWPRETTHNLGETKLGLLSVICSSLLSTQPNYLIKRRKDCGLPVATGYQAMMRLAGEKKHGSAPISKKEKQILTCSVTLLVGRTLTAGHRCKMFGSAGRCYCTNVTELIGLFVQIHLQGF